MNTLTRWLAPVALACGVGLGAMAAPAPARADDDLVRVLVDIADVVIHGGQPYYRHGSFGPRDRLVVEYDRWGRPVYYRLVPRAYSGPPYGKAYGYWRNGPGSRVVRCDARGNCTVRYYDPRYDRRYYSTRYDDHRRWDDRRWRDHDRCWWDGRRWRGDCDD